MMKPDIACLVPELPSLEAVTPYLEEAHKNRWYSNFGPLEGRFLDSARSRLFTEKDHLCATSSATAALELAVQALNLPANGKVLVPSFTFPATITAVLKNGLQPVFCDVDKDTWCMEPQRLAPLIEEIKPVLIIPVASFGNPLDVAGWDALSWDYAIPVLIDAAAALGTQATGDYVSVCYSLHATKPFSCIEGGLVASKDIEFIRTVRKLTNFGFDNWRIRTLGTNAKLSEIHAAYALAQLDRWDEIKQRRRALFEQYRSELKDANVEFQHTRHGYITSVLNLLFPSQQARIDATALLKQHGIETRQWYWPVCHMHNDLKGDREWALPEELHNTRMLTEQLLGVPFHLYLSKEQVSAICQHIKKISG